jgi:hypothetical protein
MTGSDTSTVPEENEHRFGISEVLEKCDGSLWKVTNRMIDVDTDEVLYRLREDDIGPMNQTEILTESEVERSFHVGSESGENQDSKQ